jgi:hypothetical protein
VFAGRNSNVTNAEINFVFLVTSCLVFKFGIQFHNSDTNEINIFHNTTSFP